MLEMIKQNALYSFLLRQKIKMMKIGTEGYILMFHRVAEKDMSALSPNEEMKVSPKFLDKLLFELSREYDFISSLEITERLKKHSDKKFIVITLDDGYKDNYTHAYPIFKKHGIPFTIFVAACFPMMEAVNWWFALEKLILNKDKIVLSDGVEYLCATKEDKEATFMNIRAKILELNQKNMLCELEEMFSNYHIDWQDSNKNLCASWEDLRKLNEDPLVTIGAHTYHHFNLKALTSKCEVIEEIQLGVDSIKENLGGYCPRVFAYPFGSSHEVGKREINALSHMHFDYAFIAYGVTGVTRRSNKYAMPRWTVTEGFSIEKEISR